MLAATGRDAGVRLKLEAFITNGIARLENAPSGALAHVESDASSSSRGSSGCSTHMLVTFTSRQPRSDLRSMR
jgi:hypothetical protein